ncbi:DegT/DnrJ/EryC1/StrS family aminotransferase [Eubacteriaceae bacterium ES3]|nr:DegT/DnrJ/EryC1/StrS family aminotransferase [Eubacteriaceae bacterium ES3]
MGKRINVTRSSMPEFEEYIEEIRSLWDSHWLTNMGEKHEKFSACLRSYLSVPYVSLFTNGHLALECILAALELEGEAITTPYTFASTTHAVIRNGLVPVFCDINEEDYTIDVKQIESLITEKTSAIIPVHVYGNICNLEDIDKIAKKYNLKVIYDAAHAFGVKVNGVGIGNFGDASMFSFHATKVFNTIEGGAASYREEYIQQILYYLKNFGITGPESVEYVGGNAKMSEFQAAMGICNLRHVDEDISKRKKVTDRYQQNLGKTPGIKLVKNQAGVQGNYAYMPVVFDGYHKSRDQIFKELEGKNIHPRKYFYPIITDYECYEGQFNSDNTPVAKYIADRVLTLPIYPDLALEDVDWICDIIKKPL